MNYRSATSSGYTNNEPVVTYSSAVHTNVLLRLGAQYRINSAWSLIVQPTALYRLVDLKPNNQAGMVSQEFSHFRDWQLGVQAQVKYTL